MAAFNRLGKFTINLDNIQYIERREYKDEPILEIYIVGKEKPLVFNEDSQEGKAILHWQSNFFLMSGGIE
jgi:hypothetical protein